MHGESAFPWVSFRKAPFKGKDAKKVGRSLCVWLAVPSLRLLGISVFAGNI
jgi:hypothetical protein